MTIHIAIAVETIDLADAYIEAIANDMSPAEAFAVVYCN